MGTAAVWPGYAEETIVCIWVGMSIIDIQCTLGRGPIS